MKHDGQIGIVTGASSGLGRHMAKLLCKSGHMVYVVARRKNLLEELKKECEDYKGEIRIISGNLVDSDFREELIKTVVDEAHKIDFLFNNAGYGTLIPFEKQELLDIRKMYEINTTAYEHLIRLVIPIMNMQKRGRIISTCSIAGLNAPVLLSTYGGTKYAVYGFMKPLRYELSKTGISLGIVFPPRMRTSFWSTAMKCYEMTEEERKVAADIITKGAADHKKIARKIVAELNTNKFIILPHPLSWMAYNVLRHMYWAYDFFMNKIMIKQTKDLLSGYTIRDEYPMDM